MKKIFYFIFLVITIIATSCDYGRDDVYNALPDIVISQVTESGIVPSQVFIGDTLHINPQITYGTEGKEGFEFKWYKQYYNSLKLISVSPELNYKMDSLGTWTIRLEVINKQTSISKSATVTTSVISKTQRGWYVLKETSEGDTDIDILGMSIIGERTFTETNILAGWDKALSGKPVSLMFTYNYGWRAPGATYTSTYIPSVFALSKNDGLVMRMTDEKIMNRGANIFFDHSDGANIDFSGAISSPLQIVAVDKGYAHIYQLGTQAFLPSISGAYSLSPYFTTTSGSAKYQLGFDEKNASFVYIKSLSGSLKYFPNVYNPKVSKISSNNMDGKIKFMENTDGSVNPDTASNVKRAYSLFVENSRNDRCILLGLDLCQIDPSQYNLGNGRYSPVMWADTIYYSAVPSLQFATHFALHKNYPILYYSSGNNVYMYDINTRKSTSFLTYSPSEEITYIHYLPCTYDTYVFRQLIVATYSSTNNSYKIYRYTINGNIPSESPEVYSGKGKVKTLMFASPNTYSWSGSGSWNDEQYQYY